MSRKKMPDTPYYYVISGPKKGINAERYMLRESGDWRGYIEMMNSGSIHVTPFMRGMMNFYADGIKSFEKITPVNDGILLAVSVWGDDYLARFLNFCLPSILEEKNAKALRDRNAVLFIHTNEYGNKVICGHPSVLAIIKSGIKVQVMILNDTVLDKIGENQDHKYWHLGMTQSMHLQYAKALNIDYHLLMPDVVYSSGFFERLFSLGKPIVSHSSFPTSIEVQDTLEKYREGVALNIPAPELISISILNVHDRMKPYIVGENKKWPKGHLLVFEGKDKLHLMSPHQTLAFVSRDVISLLSDRFFFTLDSEIEKIANGIPVYMPNHNDGIAMLEISGRIPFSARGEFSTVNEFCDRFRSQIPEKEQHKLFLQGMTMPIDRKMMGDRWYMEEEQISKMQGEVRGALSTS